MIGMPKGEKRNVGISIAGRETIIESGKFVDAHEPDVCSYLMFDYTSSQ
jgi:hypothetical protein